MSISGYAELICYKYLKNIFYCLTKLSLDKGLLQIIVYIALKCLLLIYTHIYIQYMYVFIIIIFKVTPKSYSRMNEPLHTTFNNVQAVDVILDILIALLG